VSRPCPDPHRKRAAELFAVSETAVTPEQRRVAKLDLYSRGYDNPQPLARLVALDKERQRELQAPR